MCSAEICSQNLLLVILIVKIKLSSFLCVIPGLEVDCLKRYLHSAFVLKAIPWETALGTRNRVNIVSSLTS